MLTALLVVVAVCLLIAILAGALWMASAYDAPVTADEIHMVTTPDLWKIRLCRHKARRGPGEPVFLCHGFMSNQFNFSIPPGESLADALAELGYDCWLIDLRGARSSVVPFGRSIDDPTMDDYLLRDIPAAIAYIRKATGFGKVHWIGHSMGGMLLYAYDAAFNGEFVSCAATLGSPIGFEGVVFQRPTALIAARRLSWRLFRCVQRGLITLLTTLHPTWDIVPINWKNMHPKLDARALFSTLEAPSLPVALTLAAAVERRQWLVKEDTVDVYAAAKHLKTPLFAIFGAADPLVPVFTVEAFFNAIANPDKKLLILSQENGYCADYSHVDLVFAPNANTEVFLPIAAWLRAHPIAERYDAPAETAPGELLPVRPAAKTAKAPAESETEAALPGDDLASLAVSVRKLATRRTKPPEPVKSKVARKKKPAAAKKAPAAKKTAAVKKVAPRKKSSKRQSG